MGEIIKEWWGLIGGGLISLITVYLTHTSKKTESELNMIDKLSSEIRRLDEKIKELESLLDEREEEIDRQKETIIKQGFTITREVEKYERSELEKIKLQNIITDMKASIEMLTKEIEEMKGEK